MFCRSASSTASYDRLSKFVLAQAVRCPPAENPSMPTRFGSTPHSAALDRRMPMARWASCSAPTGGLSFAASGRRGTRYLRITPVIPSELAQAATCSPSWSQARLLYPPPGAISRAAPVAFSFGAGYTLIVGLDTFVMPVTTFPLTVCFSGPRSIDSPGTLPGHRSITTGSAAAAARPPPASAPHHAAAIRAGSTYRSPARPFLFGCCRIDDPPPG